MWASNVRDGEILVKTGCGDELLDSSFMFAKSRVNKTHICQDLGRVGNPLLAKSKRDRRSGQAGVEVRFDAHREKVEGLLKVLLIVGLEGSSPGLELSLERHLTFRWTWW